MPVRANVADRALDLPPPYDLVTLRESGDAFAHACAVAGDRGAGTLVWVRRYDLAEFAVVLEPQEPLAQALLAIYVGMNALADALAVHAPPSRPVTFDWPDTIRADGVLVGGGRLGWPEAAGDGQPPDWLVFSAMIRTATGDAGDPGLRPLHGSLDELGFGTLDTGEFISSFSRHLMTGFDEWSEFGFPPVARRWLDRFPSDGGERAELADDGDLLIYGQAGPHPADRRPLSAALLAPAWLDRSTGAPWL